MEKSISTLGYAIRHFSFGAKCIKLVKVYRKQSSKGGSTITLLSQRYERVRDSPLLLQIAIFVTLVVIFDLFVFRNILLIGGFQSSDVDVGWIGIQGTKELLSPWNFENLGGTNFPAGNFFISTYSSIFFGTALGEKLIYYISIPVATLSTLILIRKLGLGNYASFLLSFVYQLNPWFVDEFMTGEPGFTWMFALLPLVAYFLYCSFKTPRRKSNFLGMTIVLSVAEMFTLQSLIVYAFLLAPLTMAMLSNGKFKLRFLPLMGVLLSIAVSLLTNIYSINTYLAAASSLVSSSNSNLSSLFGGFSSAPAQSIKLWLTFLFIGTSFSAVSTYKRSKSSGKVFLISTVMFQSLFMLIYFSIPSWWVAQIYLNFPLFTPFQNYDKFLLMSTLYTFSIVVYVFSSVWADRSENKSQNQQFSLKLTIAKIDKKHITQFISIIFALIIIITSFNYASIQPSSSNINGDYYLQGKFSFTKNQIPNQYYELRSFLLSHGETFNLSAHVLIVPQNPGDILPFFVGETIIPGFIGPTQYLNTIINDMEQNQSLATEAMALMGIKYIAIMSDPGDSGWLWGNGQVTKGVWGNGYFPQGNVSSYDKVLESWPSLKTVYKNNNLTILLNTNYVGDAYYFSQGVDPYSGDPFKNISIPSVINNTTEGNYIQLINNKEIGGNIVTNPNIVNYSYWNFSAISGNSYLLPNGTVLLENGSHGASLTQNVVLLANTTYEISLNVDSNTGSNAFPPSGYNRNFVGVYWNNYTGYNGTAGAAIYGDFMGNVTEKGIYTFRTPNHDGNISAQFSLNYEPPLNNTKVYTRYSNLSLYKINGSNIFHSIVEPFLLSSNGSSNYNVNWKFVSKGGYVVLDTLYSPEWVASTINGTIIHPNPGPFGLLEFHLNNGTGLNSIYFTGASTYSLELRTGWATLSIIVFGFIATTVFEKRRRKTIK